MEITKHFLKLCGDLTAEEMDALECFFTELPPELKSEYIEKLIYDNHFDIFNDIQFAYYLNNVNML